MINVIRTDSSNEDFIGLVKLLDVELAERDGAADHTYYAQYNKINNIKNVVVAYDNNTPVGCGAMKEFTSNVMEIKRMFTDPKYRGKGVASKVLKELEIWAIELMYEKLVLETGKKQPEAINLYKKHGFYSIPNYGQYVCMDNSVCFEKLFKC